MRGIFVLLFLFLSGQVYALDQEKPAKMVSAVKRANEMATNEEKHDMSWRQKQIRAQDPEWKKKRKNKPRRSMSTKNTIRARNNRRVAMALRNNIRIQQENRRNRMLKAEGGRVGEKGKRYNRFQTTKKAKQQARQLRGKEVRARRKQRRMKDKELERKAKRKMKNLGGPSKLNSPKKPKHKRMI